MQPSTRYARVGDAHVAYQVGGDGPLDVLFIPAFASHIEMMWDEPHYVRVLERLQTFSRLITFDKRGTGLSDPVDISEATMVENWVADAIAVLDAAGSRRAAVIAAGGGVPTAVLLAATHPRRITAAVLLNGWVCLHRSDGYPIGYAADFLDAMPDYYPQTWGSGDALRYHCPALARDHRVVEWYGRFERNSSSPGVATANARVNSVLDLRSALPSIHLPTLVLHRAEDLTVPCTHGRFIAENIPGAELRMLPGGNHMVFGPDADEWIDEAEEFLTGHRQAEHSNRVLTTLLFTDVVDSTEHLTQMGDDRWKEVLDRHDRIVRRELGRFGGLERDTAGDGFFATFAGPAHAIRCAAAVTRSVGELGLDVRVGVHTGEVEYRSNDVRGIAVHLAHRVMEQAGAGEVLVSRTVVDLVSGSGLQFEPRGEHTLKGIDGRWLLYLVRSEAVD